MAEVITRFKLETSQYDSKLRDAAKGLSNYTKQAQLAGNEFGKFTQKGIEAARSFGSISTSASNDKQKVQELVSAYNDVAKAYNNLTKEQQQSDFGKAMAQSMQQLQGRIKEAKQEMNSTGGILDQLAQKFTVNIDALKLFDMGLSAVGAALDVAKDAFFSSETNVDDWGRTVRSANDVYQTFLQSLNTGDFSGFLSRIGQVTQAAKEAYNALDELGTRMTIINPERAKLQARQQELRATIRRNGADSDVGRQALAELKKIEPLLSKSFRSESQMNYNAFEKLVRERLAEGGINLNQKSFRQFMATFSDDAAFQRLRSNARGSIGAEYTSGGRNDEGSVRRVDTRNIEQKLLDLFTDEWRQANSSFLTAAYNAQGAAASNALGNARYMKGGGGSGGGRTPKAIVKPEEIFPEGSLKELQQQMQDLQKAQSLVTSPENWKAYQDQIDAILKKIGILTGKMQDPTKFVPLSDTKTTSFSFSEDIGTKGLGLQLDDSVIKKVNEQLSVTQKRAQQTQKAFSLAAEATANLGAAFAGIEDPAAKAAGTVLQAIASIALGFAQAAAAKDTTASGWAWLAWLAAGTAAMATTISTVHSLTGFAEGGMVDGRGGGMIAGNTYSTDSIPIMANAGEVILNRAQSANIAGQLQGSGGGTVNVRGRVVGTDLLLVVDNTLRKTGRGELLTWK